MMQESRFGEPVISVTEVGGQSKIRQIKVTVFTSKGCIFCKEAIEMLREAAGRFSREQLGVEVLPVHAALGPAFKKEAGKVLAELKKADGKAIRKAISENGSFELKEWTLTEDMVTFRDSIPQEIAQAGFSAGDVYVDTELTREIECEGYAREVIRRLQDMRKELDLAVEEEINAVVEIRDERVLELVSGSKDFISGEVRAKSMVIGSGIEVEGDLVKDWDVEDVKMKMGVVRRK